MRSKGTLLKALYKCFMISLDMSFHTSGADSVSAYASFYTARYHHTPMHVRGTCDATVAQMYVLHSPVSMHQYVHLHVHILMQTQIQPHNQIHVDMQMYIYMYMYMYICM